MTVSPHKYIAITGASRGLGKALALELAGPGVTLYLSATNVQTLETVGEMCRERGADAKTSIADVTRLPDVESWAREISKDGPLDMLIMNAGLFDGLRSGRTFEDASDAKQLISVNLIGCINCASSFAPAMIEHGMGRLVFVSSLAALSPLADAPAYSASKAGLSAYANALRELLLPHGVHVTTVHPGHIETDQTKRQVGGLHFMVSAEKAAKTITKQLNRERDNFSFPWQLALLVGLSKLLPEKLRYRLGRSFRFHVSADD